MRLQEIMTRDVETVTAGESAERAWNRMRQRRIHHLAVVEGKAIVGVVSERDLGGPRGTKTRDGRLVSDLMTRNPVIVKPGTTVKQAANRMRSLSIGCLLVEDQGRLEGIVTVSDLLDLIGRGLEKPIRERDRPTLNRPAQNWGYPRRGSARSGPRRPAARGASGKRR